jgi:hypothetical protein
MIPLPTPTTTPPQPHPTPTPPPTNSTPPNSHPTPHPPPHNAVYNSCRIWLRSVWRFRRCVRLVAKTPVFFVMSVLFHFHLPVRPSVAHTGKIYIKFNAGDLCDNKYLKLAKTNFRCLLCSPVQVSLFPEKLRVLYLSQNKQRLLPCITQTDWFL